MSKKQKNETSAKAPVKLARAEKKEIQAVIRKYKGDGKPHSAQASIPYEAMYQDGVCRVTPRTFSKCMAMNKLERIEKDIEKTKGKIAELQKQLRELEAAKTEQENLQIVQLVRGLNMTPQEFAAFVRGGALQAAPAPIPDFEQEDSAHEEI